MGLEAGGTFGPSGNGDTPASDWVWDRHIPSVSTYLGGAFLLSCVVAWTTSLLAPDGFRHKEELQKNVAIWLLVTCVPLALCFVIRRLLKKGPRTLRATLLLFAGQAGLIGFVAATTFIALPSISIVRFFLLGALAFGLLGLVIHRLSRKLTQFAAATAGGPKAVTLIAVFGACGVVIAATVAFYLALFPHETVEYLKYMAGIRASVPADTTGEAAVFLLVVTFALTLPLMLYASALCSAPDPITNDEERLGAVCCASQLYSRALRWLTLSLICMLGFVLSK
jgi:FtsH-binding integral membrane protein